MFFGYGSLLEASGKSNMTTALAKTDYFLKLLLNKEVSAKKQGKKKKALSAKIFKYVHDMRLSSDCFPTQFEQAGNKNDSLFPFGKVYMHKESQIYKCYK